MKTKEELNALKNEIGELSKKLAELTDDELKLVAGGVDPKDAYENIIIGNTQKIMEDVDKDGKSAE